MVNRLLTPQCLRAGWSPAVVSLLGSTRSTIQSRLRSQLSGSTACGPVPWHVHTDNEQGINLTGLDAVVILAGGQTPEGGLPAWVERRLDASVGIFKLNSGNCPILCLGGGTPHKPPILDTRGYVVHESTACADYLIAKGVPPADIVKEVSSYDTVGNSYFALAIHALPAGWRRLAVVTSDFHMPRTRALFEDMFAIAGADLFGDKDRFDLVFCSVSDDGLFASDILEARVSKEAASLAQWKCDYARMKNLKDLHQWLHSTHLCYSVARQAEFGKHTQLDAKLLSSY